MWVSPNATIMTSANSTSSSPQRTGVSLRKTNKPLMEKRRRARINDSLSQLKSLVIQSSKKDSSQFNKLEKADILELTVKHLRSLQDQQQQMPQASEANLAGKYQAGFMECANEVIRYLGQSQSFSDDIKSRVIRHLASCIQLSNKTPFHKPIQSNNIPSSNASSVVPGVHSTSAQLANGQIVQILNTHFQNVKTSSVGQAAPAASNLSVSSSCSPVVISSDAVTAYPVSKPGHCIRYTQPLHIQIPPVLSQIVIQTKGTQIQKPLEPQVVHKVEDPDQQVIVPQSNAPQEVLVSSTSSSPHPADVYVQSPHAVISDKSHMYYLNDDHYADFMPRSRTYSFTSSASSESELTSPLNLSQSPKYYDQKEINNNNIHTSPMGSLSTQSPITERTSARHLNMNGIPLSQSPTSNCTSVIVDARKSTDGYAFKYMYLTHDSRLGIRHDGLQSPASSMGEDRLWRPW